MNRNYLDKAESESVPATANGVHKVSAVCRITVMAPVPKSGKSQV